MKYESNKHVYTLCDKNHALQMYEVQVCAEMNEICGWNSMILDILFKMPSLENSPFKV
jgi:hypothetical protein